MKNEFFQSGPELSDPYLSDTLLRSVLEEALPKADFATADLELKRLGSRAAGDLWALAVQAEREQPEQKTFSPSPPTTS